MGTSVRRLLQVDQGLCEGLARDAEAASREAADDPPSNSCSCVRAFPTATADVRSAAEEESDIRSSMGGEACGSERLEPSRGTSATGEVIQSREFIDSARSCLELAAEMCRRADEQVAGAPVSALKHVLRQPEEAEAVLSEVSHQIQVAAGRFADPTRARRSVRAHRPDAVDPRRGYLIERVVDRGRIMARSPSWS